MIFGQSELIFDAVPLGVGTQTMTTMIGALVFARFSGCRAVIAGPDINPVVFLAEAAKTIVTVVCPDGGSEACDNAHKAVPTVMMAGLVATLMVGLVFLTLGRFRMTVIVGFIPSNVVAGFLSCIGYKVLNPTPVPIPPIPCSVPIPIPIPVPVPTPIPTPPPIPIPTPYPTPTLILSRASATRCSRHRGRLPVDKPLCLCPGPGWPLRLVAAQRLFFLPAPHRRATHLPRLGLGLGLGKY